MTTVAYERVDVVPPPLLLPEHPRRMGPISRRLMARLVVGVAIVEAIGAALIVLADDPTWRALGVGLVYPGAGFLYAASPLLFVLSQVLLVVALVLWWGVSTHFSIPVVWLTSAVGAAVLADGPRLWVDRSTTWGWAIPVAYVLAVAVVATMVWKMERRFRAKRAKVTDLNTYLASATLPDRVTTLRAPDAMDAELLRWCYDFAEQPDDGLAGLEWGEQFHGGTQLRYQLNAIAWAMSLYAANYLPNGPTRMTEALAAVVRKHTDLRVWGYWRTLNLLGNFDPNPDPIRRDNIMFSAFLGDVINSFESATGDPRFDEPGALTFVWKDGRTFEYDHHTLTDAVRRNFEQSRLGFFPCEPGWSFTVCNVMGAQALHGHDTLHGTAQWDAVRDRWRQTLDDEYLTPDGSYAHIRSNHIGVSWDTGEVPGGHYFANGTHRFADILPDHARRAKALDLRSAAPKMQMLSSMVVDGTLDLELPPEPERHHTSSSSLLPWIKIIGGARMLGDQRLIDAAIDASARQCATGERWPQRPVAVGGSALGSYMLLRWSAPLDLAELAMRGWQPAVGPRVEVDGALLTLARSDDGVSLDVAVHSSGGPCTLHLTDLDAPSYRLHGHGVDRLVDVVDGRATLTLSLAGDARWTLEPQP
jgi:Linalool dehydratase/isomerase